MRVHRPTSKQPTGYGTAGRGGATTALLPQLQLLLIVAAAWLCCVCVRWLCVCELLWLCDAVSQPDRIARLILNWPGVSEGPLLHVWLGLGASHDPSPFTTFLASKHPHRQLTGRSAVAWLVACGMPVVGVA